VEHCKATAEDRDQTTPGNEISRRKCEQQVQLEMAAQDRVGWRQAYVPRGVTRYKPSQVSQAAQCFDAVSRSCGLQKVMLQKFPKVHF